MTTTITDHAALLRLQAWLSPAFPTGGFAYSHGLEWAVETGDVTDGDSLREWVSTVLAHGAGRSDVILLRHAHRAAQDAATHDTPAPDAALAAIAALGRASAPSRERGEEALNQGRAFRLAVAPWGISISADLPYAVAVGAAAGQAGLDEDSAAAAYLQAFTANLISAAVRLVPLGQTTGLQVLACLEATILRVATETRNMTLDDIGGSAFRSDLASMQHETQYTRLFRS